MWARVKGEGEGTGEGKGEGKDEREGEGVRVRVSAPVDFIATCEGERLEKGQQVLVDRRVEARKHRHLEECISGDELDELVVHERGEGVKDCRFVEGTRGRVVELIVALHLDRQLARHLAEGRVSVRR